MTDAELEKHEKTIMNRSGHLVQWSSGEYAYHDAPLEVQIAAAALVSEIRRLKKALREIQDAIEQAPHGLTVYDETEKQKILTSLRTLTLETNP